jgi:hypothetical protein
MMPAAGQVGMSSDAFSRASPSTFMWAKSDEHRVNLQSHANIMTQIDETLLKTIADRVAKGECILFLGAGAHYPPPASAPYAYPEDQRPPLSRTFSERLAQQCDFAQQFPHDSIGNLQRVSLYYEVQRGRNALADEIKQAVLTGKRPSPVLCALARLNFPLVITTNYDQLFEIALRAVGKSPLVSVYNQAGTEPTRDNPGSLDPQQPFVVKVHGDVQSRESIVITDEDYIQFVLRMSDKRPFNPVPLTFHYYFTKWPTLFVGYSLLDYNLRLLFKTLRWKIDPSNFPETYSVDIAPDPLIVEVYHNQHRYINFITQDVWTFVPSLYHMITGEDMPPQC